MRHSLLAAALMSFAAQPAQAVVQNYTFKGFITGANGRFDQPLLSAVSGTVSYDNAGAKVAFPLAALYNGVRSVTFNFEGGSASIKRLGADLNLNTRIVDSSLSGGFGRDYLDFTANFLNGPVPAKFSATGIGPDFGPVSEFRFIIQDPSGTLLTPQQTLPDRLYLAPGMVGIVALGFGFEDGQTDLTYLSARITELRPAGVPEPATWAMMIAGFGLIGVARRRSPRRATSRR